MDRWMSTSPKSKITKHYLLRPTLGAQEVRMREGKKERREGGRQRAREGDGEREGEGEKAVD